MGARRAISRRQLVATESQEQAAVMEWAARYLVWVPADRPDAREFVRLCDVMFSVPNGEAMNSGFSDKARAIRFARLKREGFKFGVSDLVLAVPRGPYAGFFLEMKRERGGRTRPDQAAFLELMRRLCYQTGIAHGATEAIILLRTYLALPESILWAARQ